MNVLNEKLKSLRNKEKELLHEILLTIREVETSKLFLSMAYPSLFEYLVREVGYCPASAQRRIDAVRLMQQVPELGSKIASGSVSLTQVSKVQQALRQAKKEGNPVSRETKQSIIEKLENKSPKETESILAQEFNLEVIQVEKTKVQKDESVRIELTFSKGEMEIIESAKALLSNAKGSGSLHDVIIELAQRFVKSKTQLKSCAQNGADTNVQSLLSQEIRSQNSANNETSPEVPEKPQKNTSPLKISIKKSVLRRDQGCQFTDPVTKRKCGSRHFLHFDHIIERENGGGNSTQNLRLLCGNHHRLRHARQSL